MKRTVVSKSKKAGATNAYGNKVRTEQVIYTEVIGKNKKGKQIHSSITRHEAVA